MTQKPVRILAVAGSDSSGGAGIQADIKTATALGAYAMTAITAVTAQDTLGVRAIALMPPDLVRAQISACLDDIEVDAIKIGMLGSGDIAEAVADALESVQGIPVVLDPVLVSTSGTALLDEAGIDILITRLIPRAVLVTPNLPEAKRLTGIACERPEGIQQAGLALVAMGADSVLLTGVGADLVTRKKERDTVLTEILFSADGTYSQFSHMRFDTRHTHGTGCTLSTAIAVALAEGRNMSDAVGRGVEFVQEAIRTAPGLGRGHGPLNHLPKNS